MNYPTNPVASEQLPDAIFHCEVTGGDTIGGIGNYVDSQEVPSTIAKRAADFTTNMSICAGNQDEPSIEVLTHTLLLSRLLGFADFFAAIAFHRSVDDGFDQLSIRASRFSRRHGKLVLARQPRIGICFDDINFAFRREPHIDAA